MFLLWLLWTVASVFAFATLASGLCGWPAALLCQHLCLYSAGAARVNYTGCISRAAGSPGCQGVTWLPGRLQATGTVGLPECPGGCWTVGLPERPDHGRDRCRAAGAPTGCWGAFGLLPRRLRIVGAFSGCWECRAAGRWLLGGWPGRRGDWTARLLELERLDRRRGCWSCGSPWMFLAAPGRSGVAIAAATAAVCRSELVELGKVLGDTTLGRNPLGLAEAFQSSPKPTPMSPRHFRGLPRLLEAR